MKFVLALFAAIALLWSSTASASSGYCCAGCDQMPACAQAGACVAPAAAIPTEAAAPRLQPAVAGVEAAVLVEFRSNDASEIWRPPVRSGMQ